MPARLEEPRLVHSGYRGVRLTEADAVDGRRLSLEARWNQTDADWRFLLKEGYGVGFEDHHGQLVASAVLLPHGRNFAWISMVLVALSARRRGLATCLLRRMVDWAEEKTLIPFLDATPAGRAVYLGLGFGDLCAINRWVNEQIASPRVSGLSPVAPFCPADLHRC